jgi:hypothetical protein
MSSHSGNVSLLPPYRPLISHPITQPSSDSITTYILSRQDVIQKPGITAMGKKKFSQPWTKHIQPCCKNVHKSKVL